jgi:hypothetical protein
LSYEILEPPYCQSFKTGLLKGNSIKTGYSQQRYIEKNPEKDKVRYVKFKVYVRKDVKI